MKKKQEISIYTEKGCLIRSFCISPMYEIKDILFNPCKKSESEIEFIFLAVKHCCYPKLLRCKIKICDMVLCNCNYEICCTCCDDDCDDDKKKGQCVCDLIESIALVETALAHVLNAEGEKMQSAIEIACSIDDLLKINKSINNTITNVTHLEHILYLKLHSLSNIRTKN
jgi:hypothetical protein